MYTMKGHLIVLNDEQVISAKFKKRDFVIEEQSSQYPQQISFQMTQDKCSILDEFSVGDEIEVYFNLKGREWTSPKGEVKYFNTLESWRIKGVSEGGGGEAVIPNATTTTDANDLPF